MPNKAIEKNQWLSFIIISQILLVVVLILSNLTMSDSGDNYSSNSINLYKNNRKTTITTEKDNDVAIESTQNFLRLISIFESEESDKMSNCKYIN